MINKINVFERIQGLIFNGFVLIIFVFLMFPLVILVLLAFSPNQFPHIPPASLSLRWIMEVFKPEWLNAIYISISVGIVVAFLSAFLGLLACLALERYQFFSKNIISVIFISPLIFPAIILGIALLQYFYYIHLERLLGVPALTIGYTVFTLPYSIRSISIGLKNYPQALELAARDLGADKIKTFLYVTFPLIKSGIFASMVFSYIVSFNNVSISLFLVRPDSIPVSIKIMNYLEYNFDPLIAAVSFVTSLISLIIIIITEKLIGLSNLILNIGRK